MKRILLARRRSKRWYAQEIQLLRTCNLFQTVGKQISTWQLAEFAVLASLAIGSGALFGFVQLADMVIDGETRAFDEALLTALREPGNPDDPVGPFWVENIFINITSLGGYTILLLVSLAAFGFLLIEGRRNAAGLVLLSVAGGALLSNLSKLGFDRPRPELVGKLVEVYTSSFPSGHAMLSAVTYLTLGALIAQTTTRRAAGAYVLGIAVLLTLLVGASRIYLGVHFPSDVLAGWFLGAAWAMFCLGLALWLQKRGRVRAGDGTGRS